MPRGRGISGQGVGQKTGAGKLLNSPLVQQTRVVSKALYRTLLHYSDLSYEELVHLVQRASKSAKSSTVAATSAAESNFGALGAFLTHLLQAPFALARHPLTLLVCYVAPTPLLTFVIDPDPLSEAFDRIERLIESSTRTSARLPFAFCHVCSG